MPITLRVHVGEKRSPKQYETISVAADVTAESLEIHTPEEIQQKLRELHMLAGSAVQSQRLELMPTTEAPTNGNGHNGNGRKAYGRPNPEPTAKQKQFLRQLARERNLDAETVGEICERLVGVPLRACTKDDLSKLIDALLEESRS